MRLKSAALAVSLSLLCLVPDLSLADTLTLTGVGGASTDGEYVYPYDFTFTGPEGTATGVPMSCLNFNREIEFGETWTVDAFAIPMGNGTTDGAPDIDYRADAWLFNQYNNPAYSASDLQFAIWSILDPSGVAGLSGNDATAQALAAQAMTEAAILPASAYADDLLLVPDLSNTSGWTNGEPQDFIVDPIPPAAAPEPSSLVLFATGLLGMAGILRRRMVSSRAEGLRGAI